MQYFAAYFFSFFNSRTLTFHSGRLTPSPFAGNLPLLHEIMKLACVLTSHPQLTECCAFSVVDFNIKAVPESPRTSTAALTHLQRCSQQTTTSTAAASNPPPQWAHTPPAASSSDNLAMPSMTARKANNQI